MSGGGGSVEVPTEHLPTIDLYQTCQAAKWLGVAPWELDAAPAYWRGHAVAFQSVENEVRGILERRAARG